MDTKFARTNEDNMVTCPYCRKENPSFSQYKENMLRKVNKIILYI